jgi:hypothetical protein
MKIFELLTSEDKWTRNQLARTKEGDACHPNCPEASCFCLIGAATRCYPGLERASVHESLRKVIKSLYPDAAGHWDGIPGFNDDPSISFDDVIRVAKLAGV